MTYYTAFVTPRTLILIWLVIVLNGVHFQRIIFFRFTIVSVRVMAGRV